MDSLNYWLNVCHLWSRPLARCFFSVITLLYHQHRWYNGHDSGSDKDTLLIPKHILFQAGNRLEIQITSLLHFVFPMDGGWYVVSFRGACSSLVWPSMKLPWRGFPCRCNVDVTSFISHTIYGHLASITSHVFVSSLSFKYKILPISKYQDNVFLLQL